MTVPLQGGQTPASRKTMIVVKNQGAVGDADLLLYPLLALLCNRRPNKSVRGKGRRTRKSSQGFRFVQILVDEEPLFYNKTKVKRKNRKKKVNRFFCLMFMLFNIHGACRSLAAPWLKDRRNKKVCCYRAFVMCTYHIRKALVSDREKCLTDGFGMTLSTLKCQQPAP